MSDVGAGSSEDRPRIVLVDDNPSTRNHAMGLLAGHYQVRAIVDIDGEAALAAIRSDLAGDLAADLAGGLPDLVLLQVTPPSPKSFALLRALRADPATQMLPIILLAARNSEELCVEGMTAGADDFLLRPFGARALLARLAGVLARASARREITPRAEVQLGALTGALETALETMTSGFMALDREWRISYLNAAAEKISRVCRQDVRGRNFWEVFPNARGTDFERELRRAMADRKPARRETFFQSSGNWFEMEVQPLDDGGLSVSGRDISDRKRAEDALRLSEQRFRRTFDMGLVGIAITSTAKEYLEVNDYLCQALGYSREEFTRLTWSEITYPDDLPENLAQFNRVLAGEIDGFTLDKRYVCKDGRFVDSILSTKCVRRQDGTVDYFVSLVQDVTERKALLVSEREARSIAEESNRLKDEFLATLSHELRTPINAALMWLHLLRVRTFEKAAVEQAVDAIESSVRAQARLIDDLLDLTRIAAGKLSIQTGLVDISTVVQAAMNSALPAANAKRIPIRLALLTQNTVVSGDAARLLQVFSNLLTNAVKFTPEGGTIDVEVRGVNATLEIALRDTGEGIDPKLLPHVFERFRQADTSTTRAHTGLGLGLAIVKYLVELHGGYARAESDGRGRGATFVISLPALCQTTEVGKRRSGSNHKIETDLSGVHVLVVDDDASTQVALAHMLKAYNARADTASSVDEAMTKLALAIPDVLISDISMPGADGFELIRGVRASQLHRGLPAIALTALSRRGDRRRALQAGYDMHLAKPIDPVELVAVVASLVR